MYMEFLKDFSAKDIIILVFAVGGAWSFVKFTLTALKGDIQEIKDDNEKEKKKVEKLEEKINNIDLKMAVISEKTTNTNDNIRELKSYIKSKMQNYEFREFFNCIFCVCNFFLFNTL